MTPMGAPVAPQPKQKLRPGGGWIALAIILMVLGPGGCSVLLGVRLIGAIDDAHDYGQYRLPVVANSVEIPKAVDDGALITAVQGSGDPPDLRRATLVGPDGPVTLTGLEGGRIIDATSGGTKWRIVEVARFDAPVAGTYRLSAIATSNAGNAEVWVGHRIDSTTLRRTVRGGFLGGGIVFIIGLVALIVIIVRRRRYKQTLQAAWAGGYPPGPGTPPPGTMPPPGTVPPPGTMPPPPGPGSQPGYPPPPGPAGPTPGSMPPPPAPAPQPPPGYPPAPGAPPPPSAPPPGSTGGGPPPPPPPPV